MAAFQTSNPGPYWAGITSQINSPWCTLPSITFTVVGSGPFTYILDSTATAESINLFTTTSPVICKDAKI